MEFKSFYKTVEGGEGNRCKYPTRLDMYGCGCQHNCPYCYARSLLSFRGMWDAEHPRTADREGVKKILDKIEKGTILRLGGMTDAFQPIEKELGHSKWLVEELNKRDIGYLIVTKSDYLADYLGDVMRKDLAHIQVSVTSSLNDTFLEKSAPPQTKRMECAEKLYDMGFDVALRVSPYIPGFVDSDWILKSKVEKITVEFLRVNALIKKQLPFIDTTPFTYKAGGYYHLPIETKMAVLKPYIGKKVLSVCEDVPSHYRYFIKNVNANPDDCCNLRKVL